LVVSEIVYTPVNWSIYLLGYSESDIQIGKSVYFDYGGLLPDGLYTPPFRAPFVMAREQAATFAPFDSTSSRFSTL
jgi:hypothetical protein